MPLLAISLVSAGAIAYEVLLIRLFSIVQWYHFAFMIISIALLGYGASGTFLAVLRRPLLKRFDAAWQAFAVCFGASAPLGFALAQRLPFNSLAVAWEPSQFAYLGAMYLVLMVPFFFAANCVGLAFLRFAENIGRVYRFDLAGAGLGAAGVIAALFALAPADALRLVGFLGFLAAALAARGGGYRRRRALALAVLGAVFVAALPEPWLAPRLSPYKGLSLALRVPGAEMARHSSSPLGVISVVRSPTIPFRHAPGLSLNSRTGPPEQLGVFTDGDGMTVINRYTGRRDDISYLDFTTQALPYHLTDGLRVLVLGAGGGAGVLLARYHGARRVDAVEMDPAVARLAARDFADFAGRLYEPGHVELHVAAARAFVAAGGPGYDLIQVSAAGSSGPAGAGGLGATYVYTLEAFVDYLRRLAPGGMVAVNGWANLPPRGTLKLFATAIAALERVGVAEPGRRLMLIRGWRTATLLVKNGDFTEADVGAARVFARRRSFDVAYYPGMARDEANRYNRLQAPYFHDGAVALLGAAPSRFQARYKFDIRPTSDDRPYFFDFFKWRTLPEFLALRAEGAMPIVEWGYLVLLATLVQAAVLSAVFVLVPLRVLRKRGASGRGSGRVALYFLCLGLAFLFVEIAFIQRLVLFLGHPLYAVAVVLAAFLVFAGLGAGFSPRLAARLNGRRGPPAIAVAVAGIAVLALAYAGVLPGALSWLVSWPQAAKVVAALGFIAPLAFCMGMPFPLGLSILTERLPGLVPWAWGINGCASVISALMAALLAIHFGFAVVVVLAVALYVVAAVAFLKPLGTGAER